MLLARQIYYELGPERSIPKLRNELARRAADGRPSAPRHNNTLTRWRREGLWDEWCARQQELEIEASLERTREKRERAVDILSVHLDEVHAQLINLITGDRTEQRTRLEAIKTYYNRVGVVERRDGPAQAEEPAPAAALPPRPDVGASPEEKKAWLASLQRHAG